MKQLIIIVLAALYVSVAVAVTLSSSSVETRHPDSLEYVDNQPVKYQMFETLVPHPSNYLVIWTADWCIKCPQMVVIGKKLEAEGFDVFYFNLDAEKEKARKNNIALLPTAIIYAGGEEVERVVGLNSKASVEAQIRKTLKKNKDEPNDYDIY